MPKLRRDGGQADHIVTKRVFIQAIALNAPTLKLFDSLIASAGSPSTVMLREA